LLSPQSVSGGAESLCRALFLSGFRSGSGCLLRNECSKSQKPAAPDPQRTEGIPGKGGISLMKAETILDSLNFPDDEIIIETDRLRKTPRQVRCRWPWLKWGAAAACLLAALWMTSKLWPAARLEPSPEAELPYLPVLTASDILADSMGFEGLMAFDI